MDFIFHIYAIYIFLKFIFYDKQYTFLRYSDLIFNGIDSMA